MPCYNPLVAWRYEGSMVFNAPPNHLINKPFNLPCGKCIGCRMNYARSWALRCQLEALSYKDNCFITLTFNNEELHNRTNPWSVDVKDFQLFMKKLRKDLKKPIRFFHCGEYGEKTYRPASYTARYVTKKIKGDATNIHINQDTGEVSEINEVYCTMSRANGIGYEAYQKYKHNWYGNDFIVNGNGIKMKPPRYFDTLYEKEFPEKMEKIKKARKDTLDFVDQNPNDPKYKRLKEIENVKHLKLKEVLREIEA